MTEDPAHPPTGGAAWAARIDWRAWVSLAAFSLLLFLTTAATYASLGVVLPDMVRSQAWNWTEAGLGFTLLGAATGAASLFPAVLIRRLGVRPTLLIGAVVMASGFLSLAATRGLLFYLLGCGLCGVGYQMMALIPGTHVLAAAFKRRALPFGLYFTFGSLGGAAGPWMVVLSNAVFHHQWRLFWASQAVVALAAGVACAGLTGGSRWLAKRSIQTDAELAAEPAALRPQVYRTSRDWTVGEALRTPQFYILLAAYFSHLLCGVTVASLSVAHLSERGVAASVAGAMLSFEAVMQTAGRLGGGLLGDRLDPKHLLVFALAALVVGSAALSVANTASLMMLYACGTGLGFGLTALAVSILLLNYFGRRHNLEIFSLTCLIGTVSALGPLVGGAMRDWLGGFGPTFQLFAGIIFVVFVAALMMRPPLARRS